MPLFLTDEQTMLRESAASFVADAAPPSHLRRLRDSADPAGVDRALWRAFADMGFTGILIDEADGGLGLGIVEATVVLEQIGRNLTPSPFLASAVGAVSALSHGSAELRARWLPGVLAGTQIVTLALDEGAKHRPERTGLVAERTAGGYRLTGAKRNVPHGHIADLLIVSARTSGAAEDERGVTLFAIEGGASGICAIPTRLADGTVVGRIDFDGVEVGGDAIVGELDAGGPILSASLTALRIGASAELLGVAAAAADMTVGYLKERKQFGRTIGSFQALQHRAAHLYAELEVARAAILKAAQLLEAGDLGAEHAAHVAKAAIGLAAKLAVEEAVQMHGGIGMTDAHDIGLYMKRARVLGELYGDAEYHADRLARLAGY